MKTDDLENGLRNLKSIHLTENELIAYCDQELDPIPRARMEAHLKQCFMCERLLKLLREEDAVLRDRELTAEDIALVDRVMEQKGSDERPIARRPSGIPKGVALREWLSKSLQQMVASWQIAFQTARRADHGEEVWRWQSEDGNLRVRATIEKNADMVVDFSSSEMELEGARLRFRLGSFDQEITLRRAHESEVVAQVAVPWPYRQGNMADMSIEIV